MCLSQHRSCCLVPSAVDVCFAMGDSRIRDAFRTPGARDGRLRCSREFVASLYALAGLALVLFLVMGPFEFLVYSVLIMAGAALATAMTSLKRRQPQASSTPAAVDGPAPLEASGQSPTTTGSKELYNVASPHTHGARRRCRAAQPSASHVEVAHHRP